MKLKRRTRGARKASNKNEAWTIQDDVLQDGVIPSESELKKGQEKQKERMAVYESSQARAESESLMV